MQTKVCTKCKCEIPITSFHHHKSRYDGLTAWCKACAIAGQASLRARRNADPELRERYLKARRVAERARYRKNRVAEKYRKQEQNRRVKTETLSHYGRKCTCCGETEPLFLAIDHIDGVGNKHRRSLGWRRTGHNFYRWLKKEGYPPGFQVLCHNCNWGKYANNGVCPHKDPANAINKLK